MEHREVPVLAGLGDESLERAAGNPAERLLPHVRRAELETADSQSVALDVAQVRDESLGNENVEHAVEGGARDLRLAADARGRQRSGVPSKHLQYRERIRGRRSLSHIWDSRPSRY